MTNVYNLLSMRYIDIHCHLDFPDYGDEISGVLERMKENEVGAITIGTDLESSKRAIKIAEENGNTRPNESSGRIWVCIGVHPEEASNEARDTSFDEKEFEKLVQNQKVVAIGECGLDYFGRRSFSGGGLSEETKERQKQLFKQQIEFALKHDKPLMLHCRDSYNDVLDILESYPNVKGNSHFFAGNIEQAKRFLDLGFTMSFTGVITFTHDYDEVIKYLPKGSIMSETDAPFVAPVPHRGKRNEPSFVLEVAKKMAILRGISLESQAQEIRETAERVFGI